MSVRRKAGDKVWLAPNSGFVGESNRLKVEILANQYGEVPPCMMCDDEECVEWDEVCTEEDDLTGERYYLSHVSECRMFDEPQPD